MKIAHLILTHKNPAQLERLIKVLDIPGAEFHIHLDKKTDILPFEYLRKNNVTLVKERASVYWAGFGTIQATLNGFREIINKEIDYINVISGQDFPIQAPEKLHALLSTKKGQEFITCESIEKEWEEAAHRIRKYHFINWRIPGKFRLSKLVSFLLPDRRFPYPFKVVGRANWFTITKEAASYILEFADREKKYNAYFKWCWGADEFYFATILYNSHYLPRLEPNLVYVDWRGQTKGHPKFLTISDLEEIQKSGKFFARKIELGKDLGLIEALENGF